MLSRGFVWLLFFVHFYFIYECFVRMSVCYMNAWCLHTALGGWSDSSAAKSTGFSFLAPTCLITICNSSPSDPLPSSGLWGHWTHTCGVQTMQTTQSYSRNSSSPQLRLLLLVLTKCPPLGGAGWCRSWTWRPFPPLSFFLLIVFLHCF